MANANDTRGWIMASVSGIACCVGASIICIDLLVQRFPRGRNWRIQDSNAFLSSSLSLSFGVMLYSALYNMLPSAKSYLIEGGMSARIASYTLTGCFLGGVIGITIFSRFIHHHMPSEVVDCDHNHEETDNNPGSPVGQSEHEDYDVAEYEDTPLLSRTDSLKCHSIGHSPALEETQLRSDAPSLILPQGQPARESTGAATRPSFTRRVTTFITGGKTMCNRDGPCHGYSDPCGQECFKVVSCSPTRGISRRFFSTYRTMTSRVRPQEQDEEEQSLGVASPRSYSTNTDNHPNNGRVSIRQLPGAATGDHAQPSVNGRGGDPSGAKPQSQHETTQHHHHVPTNAFLSIGLQTSIAIALHKLPEGFITYATNHANPTLGLAVFMALFIHNITEGFAMALPLYLAIGSRFQAMFWSALLGGVSQPAGAGIAALWFHAAQNHDLANSETVYGAMFAVTAGIMTSVALQLFSESLGLTHNKNLCVAFAFVGMGILGISNALTA